MKSYGTIQVDAAAGVFAIRCEAHVAVRLKRWFPKIPRGTVGVLTLSATDESARELQWCRAEGGHMVVSGMGRMTNMDVQIQREESLRRPAAIVTDPIMAQSEVEPPVAGMKLLPIGTLTLDPERPAFLRSFDHRRDRAARAEDLGISPVVVCPNGQPDHYTILVGEQRWANAQAAGQTEIAVTVLEGATAQEIAELRLSESYHFGTPAPVQMGRRFLAHRDQFGVSQQALARRTGITPGTIHHYESLIRALAPDLAVEVEKGRLTFKEARSIADITDHERQREIAEPFLTGRLSSVYVEKIVGYAKRVPGKHVQEVLEDVLRGTKAERKVKKLPEPPVRAGVDLNKLETSALAIAGVIDAVQLQTVPEYRRLKLISTLRILESKTKIALGFLATPVGVAV